MIRFRPFRNGDTPALVDLWNRALPDRNVVRPLSVHEFDALVMNKLNFDRAGLIVAEREGRLVGFVHAGFGPVEPQGPSQRLDTAMGTIAMHVIEPGTDDPELERGLFVEAERYLRHRGAAVFYCGGQYPLNPFYWGLYGGSEFAGVLDSHAAFRDAARRAGYEPSATTALLEADLTVAERRDPKLTMLRRMVRVEVENDAVTDGWWEALAIGFFNPSRFLLVDRSDSRIVAHAWTWDIASGFAIGDGRSRIGLIQLEVHPTYRRRGLGRLVVSECMKHARSQLADRLCVQTSSTNVPALGLYASLGFEATEQATLYRLPACALRAFVELMASDRFATSLGRGGLRGYNATPTGGGDPRAPAKAPAPPRIPNTSWHAEPAPSARCARCTRPPRPAAWSTPRRSRGSPARSRPATVDPRPHPRLA